ncbi:MAG TPA: NAD-dependent epimerase/dehydratase family protein [Sphingomonas sp.]|jgi:nucleoside-diphosphate-sugar epimerase|uniref:NAD-dependent epimerase/dehydratase family protein n=1 Tax=Sphingomonas sp. TaxID=28214 RepID=UPI002EDBB4E4
MIVVTGAGGFVGQAVVERLLAQGRSVVGFDTRAEGMIAAPAFRAVVGDLADPAARRAALADGCDALIHLATVPGGAAEADPAASRRVNVDAMYDLLEDVRAISHRPRVVYASSIAVFGDPLPSNGVDDATVIAPKLVYGGHKAMMEIALAMMSARSEIDGVTVRLPGVVARPQGPSGMKSAFMSDLFHALRGGRSFQCPVSAGATIWVQSVTRCADNLIHGLTLDSATMPRTRVVTLPALAMRMADLVAEIASQTGASPELVEYRPDDALEAAFGRHPALATPAAERAGFAHDGDLRSLVERALGRMAHMDQQGQ